MKKTIMILLVLAMMLTVFAVACGNDAKPAPAAEDSKTLDDAGEAEDEVEAARGSDNGEYDFSNVTFEDWQKIGEPDEGASFRGTAIDKDSLATKDGN